MARDPTVGQLGSRWTTYRGVAVGGEDERVAHHPGRSLVVLLA